MSKEVEKTELNKTYFLIQKNIGSNWADKGKFDSESEAMKKIDEQIAEDVTKNNKFIYRLLRIEEIVLLKSKEKKPDNMLDIF